jgi:EAL domain-containing protein (putative c-di-GMP-specific phosphodiesterase class I)
MAISEADRQTLQMVTDALRQRRLALAYQPIIMAQNPDRIGFYEGLIRVLDVTGRVIPAKDFMPAVEAHEIGRQIDVAALGIGLKSLANHPELR